MHFKTFLKIWATQIRAPFLLLSIVLVLIGGGVAYQDGPFDGFRLALTTVGVVLAHIAVNLFNEFSDYKSGIDDHTQRTPFSGGSGNLQKKLTSPEVISAVAVAALLASFVIGVYLSWVSGWILMLFVVAGGLTARFYTTHLARWMLGELAAGICLGSFVVLGTYYVLASTIPSNVFLLSVVPGILTALLLLLNEFPDAEADLIGGRRHLVIVLGHKRAALLYAAMLLLSYLILLAGVIAGRFPTAILLVFLTLPLAAKAVHGALIYGADTEKLVPALAANVGLVLGVDLLIAVAYFI